MEKQHNRGQDGAGVGVIKLNPDPGSPYIFRRRASGSNAIAEIFGKISKKINESGSKKELQNADYFKHRSPFGGEVCLAICAMAPMVEAKVIFATPLSEKTTG